MSDATSAAGANGSAFRWKDLLWTLQVPSPDVLGWTDPISGVLFLNVEVKDAQRWQEVGAGDDPAARAYRQTISHETLHFLQYATTGYMYRWACEHYRLVGQALKPLRPLMSAYVDDPDPRRLLAIQAAVDAGHRAALGAHLELLDRRGPNGISVRHLLEAHAFIAELKQHWQGLAAHTLCELVGKEAPDLASRLAYDLVRARLGEARAFDYFLLIVSFALCADDPPLAFDELVDALARSHPPAQGAVDPDWVRAAAQDAIGTLIGSSGQVRDANPAMHHPVYSKALAALDAAFDRDWKLLDYFTDPGQGLKTIVDDDIRPTVFLPNERDQYLIILPKHFSEVELQALLIHSVLASRTAPGIAPVDPRPDLALAWLAETASRPIQLEVRKEQMEQRDLGGLASIDPRRQTPGDARFLCRWWGRCGLTFQIDDPAPIWEHAGIRRFIRDLADAQPAFPVYLVPDPEAGMFVVWFGSLADTEAWQGRQLDVQHASVVREVIAAIGAIESLARSLGVSARPAIQRVLSPYERTQVQSILAALG